MADAAPLRPVSRWRWFAKVIFAFAFFLLPAFLGFGKKFLELLMLLGDDSGEGAFAITPIVNYILASLGFFLMMVWAVYNGMFHDIQKPAESFMKTEAWLDEQERLHKLLRGSEQ
jgi:hypothetical protein